MSDAQILDRGYRAYDGARTGLRGAMWTVTKHSMQRALGLKRKATAKIVPILTIGFSFIPAIVFVGFVALARDLTIRENLLPSYAEYYGFISAALIIFAAFAAPEILCPDRRSGLLGLYLASPLNRNTYLVAKAAAVAIILSIVTIGPLLLMLIAYTILGEGPSGFGNWLLTLGRIVLGGLAISSLYTALSLAVSSITTRKAAAAAVVILSLIGSAAVSGAIVFGADGPAAYRVVNLGALPLDSVLRIFGEQHSEQPKLNEVPAWLTLGSNAAFTVVFSVFVWWRYRRMQVTR